jgi:hypothetical protein
MDIIRLHRIAITDYADIVIGSIVTGVNELRIFIKDGSFVDIWYSLKLSGRYSFHWERMAIDGTIYRHDNAPHQRWNVVTTFPYHFHDGREDNVRDSYLDPAPDKALHEFLTFIRNKLNDISFER